MVCRTLFAFICLGNLFVTVLSQHAYVIEELEERLINLKVLTESYERMLDEPVEEMKELYKKDFLHSYDRNFKNSDVWMHYVIVMNKGNKHFNLLAYVWNKYKNDLRSVVNFLENDFGSFMKQTSTLRLAYAKLDNSSIDPTSVEETLIIQRNEINAAINESVYEFKAKGWITYFDRDCKRFLNEHRKKFDFIRNFVKKLEQYLSKTYYFRSFLVVSYNSKRGPAQCDGTDIKRTMSLLAETKVTVYSIKGHQKSNVNQVEQLINTPKATGTAFKCMSKAPHLLHEMVSNCSQSKHPNALVAVIPAVVADFHYSASSRALKSQLKTRRVKRSFWIFCKMEYQLMFFG